MQSIAKKKTLCCPVTQLRKSPKHSLICKLSIFNVNGFVQKTIWGWFKVLPSLDCLLVGYFKTDYLVAAPTTRKIKIVVILLTFFSNCICNFCGNFALIG